MSPLSGLFLWSFLEANGAYVAGWSFANAWSSEVRFGACHRDMTSIEMVADTLIGLVANTLDLDIRQPDTLGQAIAALTLISRTMDRSD